VDKRKHHYIPRFYLSKFIDPVCISTKDPYLWVFKHGATESHKKSPKNCAVLTGFNDVRLKDGTVSVDVEDNLAKLESEAAKIYKKIERHDILGDRDRVIFSEFIWAMQMRTPYQRENTNRIYKEIDLMILRISASHPEYLKRILTECNEQNEPPSDEEVKKLQEIIAAGEFDLNIPQEYSIMNMAEHAQEMSKIISKMNWGFMIAPEGLNFITSDNPVIIKDPNNKSKFYGDGYLSSKTIELTFPLTPKICLLATWKVLSGDYAEVDRESIFAVNDRTCKYRHQYIFSSQRLYLSAEDNRLYFQ